MDKVVTDLSEIGAQQNSVKAITKGEVKQLTKSSRIFRAMQIVKHHIKVDSYRFIKRAFDISVGAIGVIMLLPIMLFIKIANLTHGDTAPVLYKQTRIGKNGKKMYIYKFRSMVQNADEVLVELLKNPRYKEEWDTNQKIKDDPRITKIGSFLRKTSIDELPQFLNVLKGDMSIIGPRPLVEGELDAHNGDHEIYESVRPGISGWWAANGRSDIDYDKRLNLEYYYCKNCSILLDIKCIYLTIKAVVSGNGAK